MAVRAAGDGDGEPEGRIARSWRLSRVAWGIVRSDRAILILAVLSTLFAAAGLALTYDLTGVFSGHSHRGGTHLAVVTLILAFPLTFVSVFFNTAIAAAAAGVLAGERLSLREALAVPLRRIGQVALWSLLTSFVGVIIGQIASRLPLLGGLAARLVGLSWSVASLFAVPILATDGCSAPECLRRSAKLVKQRWGEGVSGNVTITAWAAVAMLPAAFIIGIGVAASRGHPGVRVGLLAVGAVVLVTVIAVSAVVRETFNVVLYRYAVTGGAVGGFAESDLRAPFRGRSTRLRPGTSPSRPRPSQLLFDAWPWLASGAIAGAIAVLIEINKHHYRAAHLSGRIAAGVMLWLVFTALVRFVIWLAQRAAARF
ncbi:MAG TPA: DUF6159 family protein [Solirubrobacteraceae bacterium]|jgi:hypothetical protein